MPVYLGTNKVEVHGLTDLSGASIINNQNKTVNPSTSQQSITYDSGYTGLGTVTVTAMPTLTLPTSTSTGAASGYTSKATIGRSTSDQYINIGTGYNSAGAYYKISAVANGSVSAPTASKGTVSNHVISVTPSVTSTTGYITGGTTTGTAVSVSASELVSGNLAISSNGTNIDVTNYATVSVSVSGGGGSPTIQSLSVTPTTSEQTFNSSSVDGYKPVTVAAMPTMTLPTSAASSATSGYTSKATIGRSTSAQYINIPPGYNSAGAYYTVSAVANGTASAPTSISGTSATVSTGTNTLTLTKTVSVTPTVSAGYISAGTATNSSVSLTASVTTKAAATITPGTTNQTIASGTYLTGTQTIAGDADLVGSNILSTANIFNVQGTVVVQNYYTGSSAPSSSTGSNGDLYLQS